MLLTLSPPTPAHWLTAERVRVYSTMIVVICGIAFAAWIAVSLPSLVDPRGKPVGYDFMAFWSAARLAVAGRAEAAFDGAILSAVQHAAVPAAPAIWFPWHYPPTFLLAVLPLGLMSYPVALAAFVLGTSVLWAALVRRVFADPRAWIVAAAAPAGLINLLDGQNAFLTAGLAGFALLSLDAAPVAAGVLIGLLAIKPHLALLFPLALIAGRHGRAFAAAAATVALFAAASVAAFGTGILGGFVQHLGMSTAMEASGALPWGAMPSAYVFATSLGARPHAAAILHGGVALFAAGCVWCTWRAEATPREAKRATLLVASLLVSPFLFSYDLTWAVLAIGWMALLGLDRGFARGEREIMLAAWLVPVAMVPVQALTAVQPGFPALLLLVVAATRQGMRLATAPSALSPPGAAS